MSLEFRSVDGETISPPPDLKGIEDPDHFHEKVDVDPEQISRQLEAQVIEKTEKQVDFDDRSNNKNPLNWPYRYKMMIVVLVSVMTTIDVFATIMCLPAVPQILKDLNSSQSLFSVLVVSIWEIGEGLGPFVIAPLSEIHGRLPVYHTANICFIIFAVASALSSSTSMLIAFRFLNGSSISSICLGPALVSDMFVQEQRGTPLAVLYIGPLLGPVAAPIIGGFLAETEGWRWTFWIIAIAVGGIQIPSFLLMRETYRPKLLQRYSASLGAQQGESKSHLSVFNLALLRPWKLLLLSPVILTLSFYAAAVYGYLYIVLTTLTETFEKSYHFKESSSGLAYLGIGIGMVTGMILCGATSDMYIKRKANEAGGAKPEHRLPPMVLGGLILPVGLLIYGWTVQYRVQWMAPLVGTAIVGFGLMVTIVPTESYVVDAFTLHAASAVSSTIILRSLTGAFLSLAGPALYVKLGYGWGNSLLAFIALILLPIPILLMRHGERLRLRFPVSL